MGTKTTPKGQLKKSGENFVNAGKKLVETTTGAAKTIGAASKGIYYAIDAGDREIGSRIKNSKNKIVNFTKNNILKILIAGSILTYGGIKTTQYVQDNKDKQEENVEIKGNSDEVVYINTGTYDKIQNKKVTKSAPLTKYYLGLDQNNNDDIFVGDTLILNPSKNLHDLRTEKITKYGQKTIEWLDEKNADEMTEDEIEEFRIHYPIDATYLFVVKPYINGKVTKTQMSLDEFINLSEKTIRNTEKDIEDYNGGLNPNKVKLLEIFKSNLSGKSIVAYAMTELCEDKVSGETNKQIFDLLLQNAGVEFLSLTPAIYDGKTSYGLYQFTEYALYDHGGEERGASIVNKYVKNPEDKIPGSVIDLTDRESQTKAAYMFATYNFAVALSKLSDKEVDALLKYYQNNPDNFMNNITQLVAMCHHRPADNINLKKWIQGGFTKNIHQYGYAQEYGKASKKNYEALTK
ncbi:MAG TPA: hypothetical protein P5060_01915 [Candidatus Absconditabacterales bacterium]|nr:hypothetical protein [Candidatus Absconditabacterales bacterium]